MWTVCHVYVSGGEIATTFSVAHRVAAVCLSVCGGLLGRVVFVCDVLRCEYEPELLRSLGCAIQCHALSNQRRARMGATDGISCGWYGMSTRKARGMGPRNISLFRHLSLY
jgi:hypothetical protein